MTDFVLLGRQHGEENAKRCLAECIGQGSAARDRWWQDYVTRLEAHTDELEAQGVSSSDRLAFLLASKDRLLALITEAADRLEPAAAAARQNRAARRTAKADRRRLH